MTYVPAYDRFARPTALATGDGTAREALYDMIYSMGAIAEMTRALLATGEDCQHVSEHVYRLISQQRFMLAGIYEELGDEEHRREEASGIVRQSHVPTEALTDPAHKLRIQFIESSAKAGVNADLIGAALNLAEADVQRVIGRLSAGPKPATERAARQA